MFGLVEYLYRTYIWDVFDHDSFKIIVLGEYLFFYFVI